MSVSPPDDADFRRALVFLLGIQTHYASLGARADKEIWEALDLIERCLRRGSHAIDLLAELDATLSTECETLGEFLHHDGDAVTNDD